MIEKITVQFVKVQDGSRTLPITFAWDKTRDVMRKFRDRLEAENQKKLEGGTESAADYLVLLLWVTEITEDEEESITISRVPMMEIETFMAMAGKMTQHITELEKRVKKHAV